MEKEVDGLDAGTEYVFSVSAENSAGQGVASNYLTATTFQTGRSVKSAVGIILKQVAVLVLVVVYFFFFFFLFLSF